MTVVASGAPFTNLEDCAVVPLLSGPNDFSSGPGSARTLTVEDFPHGP